MNIAIIVFLLFISHGVSTEQMSEYIDRANVFPSTAILQQLSLIEMKMVKQQLKLLQSLAQLKNSTKIVIDKFTNQTGVNFGGKEKEGDTELHEKKLKELILHPINAYHLIKRTYTLFNDVKKSTQNTLQKMNSVLGLMDTYQKGEATPTRSDLVGAADSLMRLTKSYQMNPEKFRKGILDGPFDSSGIKGNPLDSEDLSFFIEVANGMGNKAQEEFWKKVLHLSTSSNAEVNSEEEKLVQETLEENEFSTVTNHRTFPIDKEEQKTEEITEQLCRGATLQSPEYQARLKCYLETHSSAHLLLMPLRVEQLFLSPSVVLFRDFLTSRQRKYFIDTSIDYLQTSSVQHHDSHSVSYLGRQSMSTITGKGLKPFKDSLSEEERHNYSDEDNFLTSLNKKIAEATQLQVNTPYAGEPYTITNYGIGGFYKIHHDFSYQHSEWGGRIATFLMYLTDVEAGGSTVFPYLGVSSPPSAGSALFWHSTNARGNREDLMEHEACPVVHGNKWISTKWIHQIEQFRTRPCDLDRSKKL